MTSSESLSRSNYMPALGREPGGFLDRLELPPNASEVDVARRAGELRTRYDSEFRKARAELNKKKNADEITGDLRDEKVAALDEVLNRKLGELNAIKEGYDKQCAEQRRMAREGIEDESVAWLELLPQETLSAADVLALAARPRALQQVNSAYLASLKKKWFGVGVTEESRSTLPSDEAESGKAVDLSLAARLQDEQRLAVLLGADMLWESFRYTNRSWWEDQVLAWVDEADVPGDAPDLPLSARFPTLATLPNRTVERLSAVEEEIPDRRRAEDPMEAIRRLLELMPPLAGQETET